MPLLKSKEYLTPPVSDRDGSRKYLNVPGAEGKLLCQNPDCKKNQRAVKVCHHADCKNKNSHQPLMLCEVCDEVLHQDDRFSGHLRFNLPPLGSSVGRSMSTRSCPPSTNSDEEDNDSLSKEGERKVVESKTNVSKLYRKKACRRHHTDVIQSVIPTFGEDEADKGPATDNNGLETSFKSSQSDLRQGSLKDLPVKKDQSKEWFSLKFDIFEDKEVEFIAAVKGRTLRDALQGVFESRGLTIDGVNVFLDQSNTPLPLQFETYPLGGHSLHVKPRETDSEQLKRSYSSSSLRINNNLKLKGLKEKEKKQEWKTGSTRNKAKKLPGDTMPQTVGHSGSGMSSYDTTTRRPSTLSAITDIFKTPVIKEKEKIHLLMEKLDSYALHGIPELPDLLSFEKNLEDESLYFLEDSWRDIVEDPDSLTKIEKDQQEAIWEILVTEVAYIKKLKVITNLFFSSLLNLQNDALLNEIEIEKLFSNILYIRDLHFKFWQECLSRVLTNARRTGQRLSVDDVVEAFSTDCSYHPSTSNSYIYSLHVPIEERFSPYVKYCLDESSCVQYLNHMQKQNELFKTFVTWAEHQKITNRLKLRDLLVGPLQRLMKYPLLLKAISKKTEEASQKEGLVLVIEEVERFITKVNRALRAREGRKKIDYISKHIESYEVVEGYTDELAKLVSQHSQLDLSANMPGTNETRYVLMEDSLKLRDQEGKMDVYAFLFTDMLLLTKMINRRGGKDKFKVVKQPMRIDRVVVQELKEGNMFAMVYLNEFNTVVSANTLQASSPDQIKKWMHNIVKAKKHYQESQNRLSATPATSSDIGDGFVPISFEDRSESPEEMNDLLMPSVVITGAENSGVSPNYSPTPTHLSSLPPSPCPSPGPAPSSSLSPEEEGEGRTPGDQQRPIGLSKPPGLPASFQPPRSPPMLRRRTPVQFTYGGSSVVASSRSAPVKAITIHKSLSAIDVGTVEKAATSPQGSPQTSPRGSGVKLRAAGALPNMPQLKINSLGSGSERPVAKAHSMSGVLNGAPKEVSIKKRQSWGPGGSESIPRPGIDNLPVKARTQSLIVSASGAPLYGNEAPAGLGGDWKAENNPSQKARPQSQVYSSNEAPADLSSDGKRENQPQNDQNQERSGKKPLKNQSQNNNNVEDRFTAETEHSDSVFETNSAVDGPIPQRAPTLENGQTRGRTLPHSGEALRARPRSKTGGEQRSVSYQRAVGPPSPKNFRSNESLGFNFEEGQLSPGKRSMSLCDISTLGGEGPTQGGGGHIMADPLVPRADYPPRLLTHADIVAMRKNLILSTTTLASEV